MSDERNEQPREDGAAASPEIGELRPEEHAPPSPPANTAALPNPVRARRSGAVLWLGLLLAVVILGVLSSPFWARAVTPLLPWGAKPGAADYDGLAARLVALEQRPVPPPVDADALKSTQAALAHQVAALGMSVEALRQNQDAAATTKAALAQLAQRLDALAALAADRAAADKAAMQKLRDEAAQRNATGADLTARLVALETQIHAQSAASHAGAALLAALQMRQAVEEARPFPAEYAAFRDLAGGDADLAKAAEPLAEAARDGVASRSVLSERLTDLARQVTTVKSAPEAPEWWRQVLDRMSGLVTIRHIGGKAGTGEDAIEIAQTDLGRGDLAAAIGALDKLPAAESETAQPWLRMARQRLSAEAALMHLQQLLTARLGAATRPAATDPAPAVTAPAVTAPEKPPAAPKTPS